MSAIIHNLGPTSSVRLCDRHGCPSNAHGLLRLNIPSASDKKDPPLQLLVPLALCTAHAKDAVPQAFMPLEWKTKMRDVLKARGATAVPDFENAWLDLAPFNADPVAEGMAALGNA